MKRFWTFAAFGLLVGLGVASPRASADQPPANGQVYIQNGQVVMPANGGCANCGNGYQGATQGQPAVKIKKGAFEKIKGFFNGPGCGCLPNSDISCSNLQQEYQFIFGSCRNFFGNPCFKTPEQLLSISEGEYLGRTNPGINRINRTYP
jgi:hypothetical protein